MHRKPYPTSKPTFIKIGASGLQTSQLQMGRYWYLRNTNKTTLLFKTGDKTFPKR